MDNNLKLPLLPLEEWNKSKITLHLFLQIIGKVKLAMMPRKNHWWNISLRISSKGITTGPIPYQNGTGSFSIEINLLKHTVQINNAKGEVRRYDLIYGLSVSRFYALLTDQLYQLNIPVRINKDQPYDLEINDPFSKLTHIHHYDPNYVQRYWKILLWTHNCFSVFEGRFYGKTSPVQLFWHHMDLAVTRFSGKRVTENNMKGSVDREAYSHENISFGFWPGDEKVKEPGYYAYTYPSPSGLINETLSPEEAVWVDNNGSPMAFLSYHELIKRKDPEKSLLAFMESAYLAGAVLSGWNIQELEVPPVQEV
ncbi:DUF5996 family protein [Anditalea andensis]|uniref:Uncharacterized protein n=1 Tax=Anditalea andensis TaxID=1048983 RepID=A0A074LNN5_9BACT|nr:DUF5996 family protein [Anditalea andensis]KEO75527.1 hypothetical protein EL17_01375 [Anditalea andensis]